MPIAEAVAALTLDEAKILAYYATPGQGYADVAKETGASKDEVIRVVEKVANNNRAYAKTLALEWQRINGTARPAPPAATPSPRTQLVTAPTYADLIGRAIATEVPRLVRLADKVQDLVDQLEEQLTEHEKGQALREEAARLEQRLAQIKQELAPKRGAAAAPVDEASVDTKAIRSWAAANGVECKASGRIPAAVLAAYEKDKEPDQ